MVSSLVKPALEWMARNKPIGADASTDMQSLASFHWFRGVDAMFPGPCMAIAAAPPKGRKQRAHAVPAAPVR